MLVIIRASTMSLLTKILIIIICITSSFFLAGSDYSAVHQEVVFTPGDSRTVVNIPILDDDVAENDEIFIAVLTDSNNSHISANIMIIDTDG